MENLSNHSKLRTITHKFNDLNFYVIKSECVIDIYMLIFKFKLNVKIKKICVHMSNKTNHDDVKKKSPSSLE